MTNTEINKYTKKELIAGFDVARVEVGRLQDKIGTLEDKIMFLEQEKILLDLKNTQNEDDLALAEIMITAMTERWGNYRR